MNPVMNALRISSGYGYPGTDAQNRVYETLGGMDAEIYSLKFASKSMLEDQLDQYFYNRYMNK